NLIKAMAYTIGQNIVFGKGQYEPMTLKGRKLLAHELSHVVQQGAVDIYGTSTLSADLSLIKNEGFLSRGFQIKPIAARRFLYPELQKRPAPYIKRIKVHLTPPGQNAELEWQGSPPPDATGSDSFTV